MANPKDTRNTETSQDMGADISHMFMMGTYYPRENMMRDAQESTVVHGTDHPQAGGEVKKVATAVANADSQQYTNAPGRALNLHPGLFVFATIRLFGPMR